MKKSTKKWFIYIIRCNDNSLYTGITIDVLRRYKDHHGKKGSKYLRGKKPLDLIYYYKIGDKSLALKVEKKIKQFSKSEKELLITGTIKIEKIIQKLSDSLKR